MPINHLTIKLNGYNDPIHLVDGFPMPVCRITRAPKSKSFKGDAGYGYCAAKDEFYYGFEGHIIINFAGVISGYTFASANSDERDVLQDMTQGLRGLLIGDKGYIRPSLEEELAAQGVDFTDPVTEKHDRHSPGLFCPAIAIDTEAHRNGDRSID